MIGPLSDNTTYDQEIQSRISPCDRLIDVGPGIRPFDGFLAETHLCIEPHGEYVEVLSRMGYPIIQDIAYTALPTLRNFEVILFIDVIEHMTKEDGLTCLTFAKVLATKQVVVFTPLGFMEQGVGEGGLDAWGMYGGHWQTHKSGWTPDEFSGWDIYVGKGYHEPHDAFTAIWNVS